MRNLIAALCLALAAPWAAAAAEPEDEPGYPGANELAGLLIGSFSTLEQSRIEGWGYVESETVRIWPHREDGIWLYQENAFLGASPEEFDPEIKQRPYFQRIIRIWELNNRLVLRTIYTLNDPASVVGAFADPERIAEDQLGAVSCSGEVHRIAHGYWQSNFDTCPSGLRGAVRTVSRSIHTPQGHANWDRGFDAEGTLIWGPARGGYVFDRVD
jgi:hypothetical protein